jgi:hypothetical protein
MSTLDLSKIKQVPLKETQYFKEDVKKVQIVLHHTAGNSSAPATIKMWDADDRGRIATCIVISGKGLSKDTYDGEICQAFSSKNWGYHLGLKQDVFRSKGVPYKSIDPIAIGIEICNWGPLTLKSDNKYYNYVDRPVPNDQVCELSVPYKGHKYYHAYTDAQIESVRQLLVYWSAVHGIDLTYNEDIWDLSVRALKGENGVFTHNSYRKDKSDVSPQPKLIAMLKSLKS